MIKIQVKGMSQWWGGDPITVQWGFKDEDGDFVLEGCNHAGATTEYEPREYRDMVWQDQIMVCDKCDDWLLINEEEDWR